MWMLTDPRRFGHLGAPRAVLLTVLMWIADVDY
jgi:hypothetical protein